MATSSDEFDWFQLFEVKHNECCVIRVTVLEARKVSKGLLGDLVDTPDPFVILRVNGAAHPEVTTTAFVNNINPVWNESFDFFVEANTEHDIEIILMDENYITNEVLGSVKYHIRSEDIAAQKITFKMEYGCELDLEIGSSVITKHDLRYSLSLCQEEKHFRKARRNKVLESMKVMFGEDGPKTAREVPTIGVLGSGGGFRAMVGMGGAISALTDSQLWDLVTYTGVLSGSSWYLSQLYSNQRWPGEDAAALQEELKANIRQSQLWLYTPSRVYKYLEAVLEKKQRGQPVSFTDLFGHLIGETLIKNRKEYRLSDMQEKIKDGAQPFPLFSCLHVKRNVSALTFHEWVEFNPFEIGMAKYGTFLPVKQFGSMFFMGKIIKTFEEPPLHYLLGLWGSAFTILLTRVFNRTKKDPIQTMRPDISMDEIDTAGDGKLEDFNDGEDDSTSDDDDLFEDAIEEGDEDEDEDDEFLPALDEVSESDDETFRNSPLKRDSRSRSAIRSRPGSSFKGQLDKENGQEESNNNGLRSSTQSVQNSPKKSDTFSDQKRRLSKRRISARRSLMNRGSTNESELEDSRVKKSIKRRSLRKSLRKAIEEVNIEDHAGSEISPAALASFKRRSIKRIRELEKLEEGGTGQGGGNHVEVTESANGEDKNGEKLPSMENMTHGETFLQWALQTFLHSTGLLYKRFGRAAKIHNFMRGLCLSEMYPFSPLASMTLTPSADPEEETPFGEIFEKQSTEPKTLYLVDAGLTFNSPYPLLLRPQRGVDIYLSFDFSRRPKDSTPPFKELLLASKWARLNRVPFPPIDANIIEKEGWKECYVFKDDSDPTCPVVLHFPLVNVSFKDYRAPGVLRETKEEKDFGNFTIFDDPKDPYSTYNFSYEPYAFDRLNDLVKYNILLNVDLIKREIIQRVQKKREAPVLADLSQIMLLKSKLKKIRGNIAPKLFSKRQS